MKLGNVSKETAIDLIKMVNGLHGLKYDGHVDYTAKSGQRTKFDYVTLGSLLKEIKKDNNFAVLEPLGTDESGEPALQVILVHKSGETLVSDYYKLRTIPGGSKQDEGSAITYTKRYALGSFLGVSTETDDDGKMASESVNGEATNLKPAKAKKEITATEKQLGMIKNIYKDNVEELKELLKSIGKEKIDELTITEASNIIKSKKEVK